MWQHKCPYQLHHVLLLDTQDLLPRLQAVCETDSPEIIRICDLYADIDADLLLGKQKENQKLNGIQEIVIEIITVNQSSRRSCKVLQKEVN